MAESIDDFMFSVLIRQQYEEEHDRRVDYILALDWVLDAWRPFADPKRKHLTMIAKASAMAMDRMDAEPGDNDGPSDARSATAEDTP